jgi:NCS1 family nucleobase:cation symporter-1
VLNLIFPIRNMDQMDSVDVYGTFTAAEARRTGVAPLEEDSSAFGITGISVGPGISEKEAMG